MFNLRAIVTHMILLNIVVYLIGQTILRIRNLWSERCQCTLCKTSDRRALCNNLGIQRTFGSTNDDTTRMGGKRDKL